MLGGEADEQIEQVDGVIGNGTDVGIAQKIGEDALHDLAIFEYVADAGQGAKVVFEDAIVAVLIADQIGAVDVNVAVEREFDADQSATEVSTTLDQCAGDFPFLDDALVGVDVL